MTREHKLALIVGFSLVLVLGVLISDHFSPARRNELAEDIRPSTGRDVGAVVQGVRLASEQGVTADGRMALPGVTPANGTPVVSGPIGPTQQGATPSDQLRQLNPDVRPVVQNQPQQQPGTTLTMGERPPLPGMNGGATGRDPAVSALAQTTTDPVETLVMGDPNMGQPTSAQTPEAPATVQIPLQRHDVREGDTLYRIAVKYYGDGKLWEKVREYNKDKVSGSGTLREGVTLLLPPKDVLLGKPYVPTTQPQTTPAPKTTPDGKPVRPETRVASGADSKNFKEYVVKEGDTLSAVAKKTLGSTKRWPEIVEANRGTLKNEDALSVGMKLKIPAAR